MGIFFGSFFFSFFHMLQYVCFCNMFFQQKKYLGPFSNIPQYGVFSTENYMSHIKIICKTIYAISCFFDEKFLGLFSTMYCNMTCFLRKIKFGLILDNKFLAPFSTMYCNMMFFRWKTIWAIKIIILDGIPQYRVSLPKN